MRLLNRSRSDLILGLWALATALGFFALMTQWQRKASGADWSRMVGDPNQGLITTADWIELLVLIAVGLIAEVLIIRDIWTRRMSRPLRKLWTALVVICWPVGALVYWVIYCQTLPMAPAEPA